MLWAQAKGFYAHIHRRFLGSEMSGFRGNKWISWISLFRQIPSPPWLKRAYCSLRRSSKLPEESDA